MNTGVEGVEVKNTPNKPEKPESLIVTAERDEEIREKSGINKLYGGPTSLQRVLNWLGLA